MQDETLTIKNTTRKSKVPSLPYLEMKNAILGKEYELALVFVGDKKSRTLNKTYRDKTYAPNILSFPIDKNTGDIFINPNTAKKQAPLYDRPYNNYIGFLFIHGLVHLLGHEHSDEMDRIEEKFRKKFGI